MLHPPPPKPPAPSFAAPNRQGQTPTQNRALFEVFTKVEHKRTGRDEVREGNAKWRGGEHEEENACAESKDYLSFAASSICQPQRSPLPAGLTQRSLVSRGFLFFLTVRWRGTRFTEALFDLLICSEHGVFRLRTGRLTPNQASPSRSSKT